MKWNDNKSNLLLSLIEVEDRDIDKDATDGNDGALTDDLYLKFVFERSRAGGLIVEERKQSLQLLHGDAEWDKKTGHAAYIWPQNSCGFFFSFW